MRTSVSGERVTFLFSTEAGEKQHRERFEWTRLKKGDDHEAKSDGFRLVQVSKRPGSPQTSSEAASESVNGGSPSFLAAVEYHESLALLSWVLGPVQEDSPIFAAIPDQCLIHGASLSAHGRHNCFEALGDERARKDK